MRHLANLEGVSFVEAGVRLLQTANSITAVAKNGLCKLVKCKVAFDCIRSIALGRWRCIDIKSGSFRDAPLGAQGNHAF
jgi:hypothetical protein